MRRFGLVGLVTTMFLVAGGGAGASHDAVGSGSRWVATDLGNLARDRWLTVADINDRGQVVGGSRTQDGGSRGFIWQNGRMTDSVGDRGRGAGDQRARSDHR